MAVTGVTGKNKTFIIIFATKSLIITCDNCDTLEWTVVVAILNDNVTHETSGTRIMASNSLLELIWNWLETTQTQNLLALSNNNGPSIQF